MTTGKRRLSQDEIRVGERLPWDVYDAEGRLLLKRGLMLDSTHQVTSLIERGLFAESAPVRAGAVKETHAPEPTTALTKILEARRLLTLACSEPTRKEHFVDQIMRIVTLLHQSCRASQEVALATTLLQRDGRYSIRHSIDSALVTYIVGLQTGMQEGELKSVTAAALTMNVSMLSLQDRLQQHAEPLTPEERQAIERHPTESADMLGEYGVSDELWLVSLQDHHESIGGMGYPAHKMGDDLLMPTRVVTLADVYCAKVSGRDYRAPMRPNDALRTLYLGQGGSIETFLTTQFIRALGVFPPGTPVRLNNGEIAIVIRQGPKANTPVVCSVIGANGMRLNVPVRRDTSLATFGIRETVQLSEIGAPVNMQALWGKEGSES